MTRSEIRSYPLNSWAEGRLGNRRGHSLRGGPAGASEAMESVFRHMRLNGRDIRHLAALRLSCYGAASQLCVEGRLAPITERGEQIDHLIDLFHRQHLSGLPFVARLSTRPALLGFDPRPGPCLGRRAVRRGRLRGIARILGELGYLALQLCNPGFETLHCNAQGNQ